MPWALCGCVLIKKQYGRYSSSHSQAPLPPMCTNAQVMNDKIFRRNIALSHWSTQPETIAPTVSCFTSYLQIPQV